MHQHCNWRYISNGYWTFFLVYLKYYYCFGSDAFLTSIQPVLCIASISPFPQEKNENKKYNPKNKKPERKSILIIQSKFIPEKEFRSFFSLPATSPSV